MVNIQNKCEMVVKSYEIGNDLDIVLQINSYIGQCLKKGKQTS